MKLKRLITVMLTAFSLAVTAVHAESPQPSGGETEPFEREENEQEKPESLPLEESDPKEDPQPEQNPEEEAPGETEPKEEPSKTPEETEGNPPQEEAKEDAPENGEASQETEPEEPKEEEPSRRGGTKSDPDSDADPEAGNGRKEEGEPVDVQRLRSKGQAAQFASLKEEGGMDFVQMFFFGERPCYCVEPEVSVIIADGTGDLFSGHVWTEAEEAVRERCKRIAYYGYGNSRIGTSNEAYVATQLLIWEAVSPELFERINSTLHMCPMPTFEYRSCEVARQKLDTMMARIRSLVDAFDTVPSFASANHKPKLLEVKWGETLELTDRSHVLSMFESDSEEEHPGIRVSAEGDRMSIEIDDLFYSGWNEEGKVLTFSRREQEWENVMSGVLLYECGDQQKLITADGVDPVRQFQLSIRLRTAGLRIEKLDEYLNGGKALEGAEFILGMEDDPEIEHPIRGEDGEVYRLRTNAEGVAETGLFLPESSRFWIREVAAPEGALLDERIWPVETGRKGTVNELRFVDPLQDVNLELFKTDEEEPSRRLNEAGIVLYEIGEDLDLSPEPTPYGLERNEESDHVPPLSWHMLEELAVIRAGESFDFGGWHFVILEVKEDRAVLEASFPEAEGAETVPVEVLRKDGLSFADVEAARYGEKKAGMHVRKDGILYRIEALSENEVTLLDEAGRSFVIHALPDASDPFSLEEFLALPTEFFVGDEITVNREAYRCLAVESMAPWGTILRLKRLSDHQIIEVRELADDVFETETLLILKTGEARELALKGEEQRVRLRTANPHIHLAEEDGKWKITANENCTAVLEVLDSDGDVMGLKRLVFSTQQAEREQQALPVFAGSTGHQYVRIMDPANHNLPVAGLPVVLFTDQELTKEAGRYTSDRYGAIDVSELSEGVYYWRSAKSGEIESVTVEPAESVTGKLSVSGLKWGRTYLAVEENLPEGYDYGTNEPAYLLRAVPPEGTDTVSAELANFLRRIDIRVYKLDQEDQKTPLNDAWFTLRDVTGADPSAEAEEEISLSDLPPNGQAGDLVSVWKENPAGREFTFRVEEVNEEGVILSRLEEDGFRGRYEVLRSGWKEGAPMLYRDIERCLGTPRLQAVFRMKEKMPSETIRVYRIVSLEKGPGKDVFGNPGTAPVIRRALLVNLNDRASRIYSVPSMRAGEGQGGLFLGEYVSGGLVKRAVHEEPVLPLSFERALELGLDGVGKEAVVLRTGVADMPGYDVSRNALNSGSSVLSHDGVTWKLEGRGEEIVLSLGGNSSVLKPNTRPGAMTWEYEDRFRVLSAESGEEGLSSLTIADSAGNSWYLEKGQPVRMRMSGTPGLYLKVTSMDGANTWDGYTDRDGRVLLAGMPEGNYRIRFGEEESIGKVEAGVINLPDMKYGHSIEICETKSPLGYLIGNACAVIVPTAGYTVDTVTNSRTNEKIVTRREEVRRMVMNRRTKEE